MWRKRNICKALYVIGGFLCYMFADGCTFSIGILYQEFLNVFHSSKAATAVLPGLIYALPQIMGPLICPVVDTVGSAWAAFLGSFLLALSFLVSRFVVSLGLMYFTMGFLSSVGLELTYVSGIMAVTKGFVDEKYMGLALGITVSGSGIGVFIFNPLLTLLIEQYSWKGALTVESAIFLHIVIGAALFQLAKTISSPLSAKKYLDDTYRKEKKNQVSIILVQDSVMSIPESEGVDTCTKMSHIESQVAEKEPEKVEDVQQPNNPSINHNNIEDNEVDKKRLSAIYLSMTQTRHCEPFFNPIRRSSSLDKRMTHLNNNSNSNENSTGNTTNNNDSVCLPMDERSKSYVRRLSLFQQPQLNHKEINDVENDSFHLNDTETVNNSTATDHNIPESLSSHEFVPNTTPTKPQNCHSQFLTDLQTSLLSMFNAKLWTNCSFLLYTIITLLLASSVVVPWTFSFDHALSLNIPVTVASLMVSLIGVGSCIGQIVFGILSDHVPAISLYSVGCLSAGISVILLRIISASVFVTSQAAGSQFVLLLLHFIFGFSQGVCYSLFSVILVHYVGTNLYSASLGIYLMFSGFGNLIGTTLAGHINDVTYSYDLAYSLSGAILILCSLLCVPLCWKWHKELKNNVKGSSNEQIVVIN